MWLLSVFTLLLAVASAARVSLTFTLDPGRNMSSLLLYRPNGAILMGRCGRRINATRPVDFSEVTVNVDDKGRVPRYGNYDEKSSFIFPVTSGNFTVGPATYAIHPNPVFSGGPSCKTDVDPVNNRISVYCRTLYWDYKDISKDQKTIETDCFGPFPPEVGEHESDYYTEEQKPDYKKKSVLIPKISRRCPKKIAAGLDGAGWPHQRYLFQQISENLDCGDNQTCSVCSDQSVSTAFGVTTTITTGFNAGVGPKKAGLSLTSSMAQGFSITRTWTIGNSYVCSGNPGDTVCIWYKVAHTAFTVRQRNKEKSMPGYKPQIVVAAPNRKNEGGGVFCRYNNECGSKGEKYWDCYGRQDDGFRYCPPPGHPPKLLSDGHPPLQNLESAAIKRDREAKKERIISRGGKEAWKDYERKEMRDENTLKLEHAKKWERQLQNEELEKEEIKKEEEEAEESLKEGKDQKKKKIEGKDRVKVEGGSINF